MERKYQLLLNPDASENYPNMIVDGDRNLTLDGIPVKPGIVTVSSTNLLDWTDEIHHGFGNISLADGSVQQMTAAGFNGAAVMRRTAPVLPHFVW